MKNRAALHSGIKAFAVTIAYLPECFAPTDIFANMRCRSEKKYPLKALAYKGFFQMGDTGFEPVTPSV